jgi:non-specific serine/threonine protein kinase
LAFTVTNLGRVAVLRNDEALASSLFAQVLQLFQVLGDRWATAQVLEDLAALAQRSGRMPSAGRLLGMADAARIASGAQVSLIHRNSHQQVLASVRTAMGEEAFAMAFAAGASLPLDDAIAESLAELSTSDPAEASSAASAFSLTSREGEVLRLLVDGRTDREIAAALSISPRTVGGHVTNLLAKLGVESRTSAAAFAVRHGLDGSSGAPTPENRPGRG